MQCDSKKNRQKENLRRSWTVDVRTLCLVASIRSKDDLKVVVCLGSRRGAAYSSSVDRSAVVASVAPALSRTQTEQSKKQHTVWCILGNQMFLIDRRTKIAGEV